MAPPAEPPLTGPNAEEPIVAIVSALRSAGTAWALIGAAARNAWAPPRLTTDLDVAVAGGPEEYARVAAALALLGYRAARAHRSGPQDEVPAVTIFRDEAAPPGYRQVDVLVAGTDFERQAIARAVERPLGAVTAPVVTREDLIVYKLIAWRPRDRQDVHDVLATARAAGVAIDLGHLRHWAAEWDVAALLEAALAGEE